MIIPPVITEPLDIISLDAYRIERKAGTCLHAQKVIDPGNRSVKCRACDAPLDAFDCLQEIAQDHERRMARLKELKRLIEMHETKLANTKRDEMNTKSRLKRLQASIRDCMEGGE